MPDSRVAYTLALFVFALACALTLQPAMAQSSGEQLDAILEDIEKQTDPYSRFRSLLSDSDQAKRMAAFNAMTESGVITLQEMALDYAFTSEDPAMRAAALRSLLTSTKALTFNLLPSDETSERTRRTMSKYGGGFSIKIDSWDVATASFVGGDPYSGSSSGQGQLSGLSLHYHAKHCRTSLVLDDSTRNMVGMLACTGFQEPVEVSLAVR